MNKKDFNAIKNRLNQMQESQELFMNKIKENPNVSNWTIQQLRDNLKKARKLMADQDIFVTNELYHLIGMGNLTVTQTSTLLKYAKQILSARCFIKQASQINTTDIFKFNVEDFNNIGKGEFKSNLFNLKLNGN